MLIKHWMRSITELCANGWVQSILLTLYYLAILIGLLLLYGQGNFSTPKFIYQGF